MIHGQASLTPLISRPVSANWFYNLEDKSWKDCRCIYIRWNETCLRVNFKYANSGLNVANHTFSRLWIDQNCLLTSFERGKREERKQIRLRTDSKRSIFLSIFINEKTLFVHFPIPISCVVATFNSHSSFYAKRVELELRSATWPHLSRV